MKSIFKKLTAVLALIVILYSSCKNPADDVGVIINTDIFKSQMAITFVNAKEGASNNPQDFEVEISGANANLVVTNTGSKDFKASRGFLQLALDRSAAPSETNPIKFTVSANVPGFAPTVKNITITSPTDPLIVVIQMVEYANPAAGTGVVLTTRNISNGTAASELVLTTATNADMTEKSNITIPAGTSFLDASGEVINANQIEARVVHYGASTTESTSAFPGGFYADNAIGDNGQAVNGGVVFVTGGFLAIDLFAGNKEVKGFTKPVVVEMEVSNTLINPNTGLAVKENETIPLWSLNEETGQWKHEGTSTFLKNAEGKLVAKMAVNHLSYWNFDWYYGICNNGGTLTIKAPKYSPSEYYKLYVVTASGGRTNYPGSIHLPNGTETRNALRNLPSGGGKFILFDSKNKLIAESQLYANMCGQNTTLTIPETTPPDIVEVSLSIQVKCSNKKIATGLNAYVMVSKLTGGSWSDRSVLYLSNGRASGKVLNGETYKIEAYVGEKWYSTQFKFDKKNFVLPFGQDITGTATYSAVTNLLSINGLFTSQECK